MEYNPKIQTSYNGTWTPEFRERVTRIREETNMSFKELGKRLDFSGSFVSQLTAGKSDINMGTRHAVRVERAVRALELEVFGDNESSAPTTAAIQGAVSRLPLEELINQLHQIGYSVQLSPLSPLTISS